MFGNPTELTLLLVAGVIINALYIVPCWRIVNKAGYHGAWSLLTILPLVNLIALWLFAFIVWPSERYARVLAGKEHLQIG
jgi:hypothetical protein